jgi:hypothetical protein
MLALSCSNLARFCRCIYPALFIGRAIYIFNYGNLLHREVERASLFDETQHLHILARIHPVVLFRPHGSLN